MTKRIFTIVFCISAAALSLSAQSADNRTSIFGPPNDEKDRGPTSFRETLSKLRIEQSKKDYQEMLNRGEEALQIANELDRRMETTGRFTSEEFAKLAEVEKLVKKIRGDLGGGDDDDEADAEPTPTTVQDGVKRLRSAVVALDQDLKKTNRFSISATAIETTNAILRVTRFLRIGN